MAHGELNAELVLETAERIARSAGELVRAAYSKPRRVSHKGKIDLVTQADHESEAAIVAGLRKAFPDHAILAEEGSQIDNSSGLIWLVDPLDGTTNFAHGFPVFVVSLALRWDQETVVAVTYDPLRDECFTAAEGLGTCLNGQPVRVTEVSQLEGALLATGFPYDRHHAVDNNTSAFSAFIRRAQGVRRMGAAALDLAYVACGRLDGYWELRLYPWDVAAGILLVREAGGRVTDYAGLEASEPLLSGKQIVASNGLLHAAMLETLQDVYDTAQVS